MRPRYFYGYNIVASGFVTQAASVGAMFIYGVLFKEFEASFGWSRALVSGASSFAFFIMGAMAVVAGPWLPSGTRSYRGRQDLGRFVPSGLTDPGRQARLRIIKHARQGESCQGSEMPATF